MRRWTDEEIETLKMNYCGVHARIIAQEINRSVRSVILKAIKLGLKSELRNKGNGQDNIGPNNPNWKGSK